jgi:hypothetical protein
MRRTKGESENELPFQCLALRFLKYTSKTILTNNNFRMTQVNLDVSHDLFCDSIITYAMIAMPIIAKTPGTIIAQIWGICCPHPKSTNISKSATIPKTAAITQITIDLIFLEFPISFSVLTSYAFKFD